jgi:hypothetical protein
VDDATLISIYPILKYFTYGHLPEHLQERSKPYAEFAFKAAADGLVDGDARRGNPETAAGLRKLLEAKDCFVRAAIK